jgi:hypothetical protein
MSPASTGILAEPSRTVRLAAVDPHQAWDQGNQTPRSLANSAIGPRVDETTIDATTGVHVAKETAALGATTGAHVAK